jgi:hypothetical protein
MPANLTSFFEKVGMLFRKELENNVRNQVDIDGQRFSPIALSTQRERLRRSGFGRGLEVRLQTGSARGREGGKIKGGKRNPVKKANELRSGVSTKRLYFTQQFWKNAFRFQAKPQEVTVFVSRGNYPNPGTDEQVSYADIVRYNNAGSPEVNPHIKAPPSIFPTDVVDVKQMKAWEASVLLMNSTAGRKIIAEELKKEALIKQIKIDVKL